MRIEKSPKTFDMVLAATFDEKNGVLEIENRALPPVSYGTALAIALKPAEARALGEALTAYADAAG